jgi:hypothetical protein
MSKTNYIDFTKIKAGDKVWVELITAGEVEDDIITIDDEDGGFLYFNKEGIKKHIPQKTELEKAEEELHKIACEIWDQRVGMPHDVQEYLDRYFIARKTLEELKNYEKLNAK